ncbi:hypothetical protein HDV02_002122 [Globomyces sp. JEL0801]|nr:hypothetical protein HDV02_002122 [Globomyces sp. JEL0801]
MGSRAKQLDEVNAALVALQEEIQEAKEERKAAKSQLEKAILEGKPVTPFEKLLESASANLTGLQREKEKLLENKNILTRSHSSSDDPSKIASQINELLPLVKEQTRQTEAVIPFIHDIVMNMFDLVATSDRSTNRDVKLSSINNYSGTTLQQLPATVTCQFLSVDLPRKFVTCSHIFQKRWKPHRYLIGLADIHDWRNTLLLLKPIEVMFDQGQIIFLWNQANLAFEMKILNPSIRLARLHALFIELFPNEVVPANIPNVSIGDLENCHLTTGQNTPYKRCLAFHASVSRYEAIKKSMWIKAEDFPPIPEDAWSPGISEQPKLRRYLDAWIDSVNDAE